jgi:phage shock protein PspC (stress-responsive transcriptional regulator)
VSEVSEERTGLKRLHRSNTDRKLAGVCGGVAEYLGMDPTVVRVVWVVAAFFGGLGAFAYLAAVLIVPKRTTDRTEENRLMIPGLALMALGSFLFFENIGLSPIGFWGFFASTWKLLFPVFIVLVGLAFILAYRTGEPGLGVPFRERRLTRIESEKLVGGVCAGLARYFQIDPSIVRLIAFVGLILTPYGLGILFYLVMLVVIPLEAGGDFPAEPGPGDAPHRGA